MVSSQKKSATISGCGQVFQCFLQERVDRNPYNLQTLPLRVTESGASAASII
jgi:hypothetical protein